MFSVKLIHPRGISAQNIIDSLLSFSNLRDCPTQRTVPSIGRDGHLQRRLVQRSEGEVFERERGRRAEDDSVSSERLNCRRDYSELRT